MTISEKLRGQGIEQESLSGENVAREMRQSDVNPEYNLRLGPVTLRAEADVSTSFNDNIGISKDNRDADMVTTPTGIIHAHWKVSELSTINLNIGVGYEIYMLHSQYNCLILTPDSVAQFNFFVGNVLIDVHDYFSYEQDPTQVGQLSNQTRLARFTNDAGVSATWDLGKFSVELGYDHSNLWVTQNEFSYLTNQSDTITPKVTVKVSDTIDAGVNGSFSNVQYEESFQNNYINYSAGPFASIKISDFLSLQGGAGLYFSDFDTGGGNGDSDNIGSYYANGGITHKINDAVTQSLTAGREFIPGLTSNFTERIYVSYANSWQATKTIRLDSNLWWENLTDSAALFSEKSDRYSAQTTATDILSDQMNVSLGYQFIIKDANPSFESYYQNLVTVGFHYQF